MSKKDWIKHMTDCGYTPPSVGGDKQAWKDAVAKHIANGCRECKARTKTKAAASRRAEREGIMRDLGLVKVYGPVSGKVYWE